jgi:hypothetical protein
MFRRGLTVVGWGAAGVALAAALIAGAFVVAGTRLTEPATPIHVSAPPLVAETSSSREADRPAETRSADPTATRSPADRSTGSVPTAAPSSLDDHGGNSGSGGGGEPGDD